MRSSWLAHASLSFTPRTNAPTTRPYRDGAGTAPDPLDTIAPSSLLAHVVVICDGSPSGDEALHLADALSRSTGATVRALTWLPDRYALEGDAPIETFLAAVTQQLHRATPMLGFWRLELLTRDIAHEVARVCAEESAAVLIVPAMRRDGIVGPEWTLLSGVPIASIGDQAPDQVTVYTSGDAARQRHAHLVAALMTAVHTSRLSTRRQRVTQHLPYAHVQTVTEGHRPAP